MLRLEGRRPSAPVGNGLWNALASLVSAAAGVLIAILMVRDLSLREFGLYSYYVWLAEVFLVVGTLAFPNALTKVAAELRGRGELMEAGTLVRAITLGVFAANLLLALGVVVWALFSPGPTRQLLLLIAAIPLLGAANSLLTSAHWSHQRFVFPSIAGMAGVLAQVGLVTVAFTHHWGVQGYLVALLALYGVQFWVLCLPLMGHPGVIVESAWPSRATLRYFFVFCLPLTLHALFDLVIWQRSGVLFLGKLASLEQVGFYSLAFLIYSMFLRLGWALLAGFLPAISSDYGAGNWPRIHRRIAQGAVLAVLYAVPLSLGGMVMLQSIITLMFRGKMQEVVPVGLVLLAGLVPGVLALLFSATIGAINRLWNTVPLALLVVLFNLLLNLQLVPAQGALGAAIASVSAQIAYAFLLFFMMRRLTRASLPWLTLVGIFVVGLVTTYWLPTLLMSVLGSHWLGAALAVGIGALTYLLAVRLLGYHRLLLSSQPS